MSKPLQRWRRIWGIRPGELVPPVSLLGRRAGMGEPRSGPRGRGRLRRLLRLRPPNGPSA